MAFRKQFAGKAYLKIDLLVKTPLHRRSMEVRRSGFWAPGVYYSCPSFPYFTTSDSYKLGGINIKVHGLLIVSFYWVLLKAGPRPSGPAARRPGGPEARWPSLDFQQFFCPPVNPRTCTELHRVRACKIDDREFEFVYHLII